MQKRYFLALVLVASLLVQDAEARPGGRRGQRTGNGNSGDNDNRGDAGDNNNVGTNNLGARNVGNSRFGNNVQQNGLQNNDGNRQFGQRLGNLAGKLQSAASGGALDNLFKDVGALSKDFAGTTPGQLKTNFTELNRPFTSNWYASHPDAWRYSHPRADAWAVASIGTVGSWLGIAALNNGTVYTSETNDADGDDSGDNDSDDSTDETQTDGEFLPLGVFGLAATGSQDASALIQLATNRQGELRGNYYDVLSGQEEPITGTINKQTQLATFTVEGNTNATFEASLVSLTQDTGTLTLRLNGGQTRQVSLSRLENPQSQQSAE